MPPRSDPFALPRPPRIHVRDLEAARLALQKVYGNLSVEVPRDGRRFEWSASPADLGPVTVFSGFTTTDVWLSGEPSGYTVGVSSGPGARASARGRTTEITPGRSAAVFSAGTRCELRTEGPFHSTTMRIDPAFLEGQLEALTGAVIRRPLAFSLAMSTAAGAGAALERICAFLIGELAREGPSFGHPVAMASLAEVVAHTLLLGQPHDHAHLLEKTAPPSGRTTVRLVEEYVAAHVAEPIRLTDLTALAGVPMAALDAAFRLHRGTTPMAFLRKKRLELARDRLLTPAPGATVKSVAHASGFLRLDQFDAAYAAEVGESPAETQRRGLVTTTKLAGPPRRPAAIPVEEEATVFVVHGDPTLREVTVRALSRAGHAAQAFASSLTFLVAARSAGPGCAVIDIQLPELEGIPLGTLPERGCGMPVVFTSDDADVMVAVEAMKAGAVDFLLEPVDEAALLSAVRRALARDAEARAGRAEREALSARVASLSPREREVCDRVARGESNKLVAADLGISESAVRLYRAGGMEKLGVGTAAELGRVMERWRGGGR